MHTLINVWPPSVFRHLWVPTEHHGAQSGLSLFTGFCWSQLMILKDIHNKAKIWFWGSSTLWRREDTFRVLYLSRKEGFCWCKASQRDALWATWMCACWWWQKSLQASLWKNSRPCENQAPFTYSLALTSKFHLTEWSFKNPALLASNLGLLSQHHLW